VQQSDLQVYRVDASRNCLHTYLTVIIIGRDLAFEDTTCLKIPVAISACLLGESVRYDGRNKFQPDLIDSLRLHFELVALCPEVAIGLGVPRNPLQLVKDSAEVRALDDQEPRHDVTDLLNCYGCEIAISKTELCGYIFKARSPSCGLGTTPLFDIKGQVIGKTNGIFANAIIATKKVLPMADEEQLQVDSVFEEFLKNVTDYYVQQKGIRQ
jgi:uncharacterized protein YbbK (DUF523 family)